MLSFSRAIDSYLLNISGIYQQTPALFQLLIHFWIVAMQRCCIYFHSWHIVHSNSLQVFVQVGVMILLSIALLIWIKRRYKATSVKVSALNENCGFYYILYLIIEFAYQSSLSSNTYFIKYYLMMFSEFSSSVDDCDMMTNNTLFMKWFLSIIFIINRVYSWKPSGCSEESSSVTFVYEDHGAVMVGQMRNIF